MKRRSLWIASTPETSYGAPADGVDVDVVVVGGGIAGVTAAFLLKRAGKSIAVIDSKRILHGATGYTTAKVTAAHNIVYTTVAKKFGDDGARLYAAANEGALDFIARTIDELTIDCSFERKANYVYCESADERKQVEQEVEAARRAGLAARLVEETPLPYPVECAFRLDEQAQFHPRKYLLPLAEFVDGDGSHVLELTRVLNVSGSDRLRVETDRGTIVSRDVVLASHLPFLDRGFFFAKAHPERSYAVAARISPEQDPDGMYINVSPRRAHSAPPTTTRGCCFSSAARATNRATSRMLSGATGRSRSSAVATGRRSLSPTAGRRRTTAPLTVCRTSGA